MKNFTNHSDRSALSSSDYWRKWRTGLCLLAAVMSCLCFILWMGSCSHPSGNDEKHAPDGGISEQDTNAPLAFVISMSGESGTFGVINTHTHQARPQLGPVSNDAVARYWNERIFVINRLGHDNIQIMDTRDFSLLAQYSVGPKSNPQDIAIIDANKAYLSRLASAKLQVIEPMTGKLKTEIDLSHLAEVDDKTCNKDEDCEALLCIDGRCARDGLPELAAMHIHGDHLFVMVQRLDSDSLFRARDVSKIAVIDITSDKFIKAIDTKGKNPTAIQVSADGRSIYISQPGNWLDGSTAVLDGLIEEFDLVEMRHRRIVLEEKTLGGNIASVAIVSPTKGYVVRSDDNWRTELLTFNPSTAQLGDVIATSPCLTAGACHTFFQIALSPNGQLYLVDRDQKRSGIRIFDTNTDREITAQTIDMGLPPTSLIFYP